SRSGCAPRGNASSLRRLAIQRRPDSRARAAFRPRTVPQRVRSSRRPFRPRDACSMTQRVVFAVPDFLPTLGGTTRQTSTQARAPQAGGYATPIPPQGRRAVWPRAETLDAFEIRRVGPPRRDPLAMKQYVLASARWFRAERAQIDLVQVIAYPDLAL